MTNERVIAEAVLLLLITLVVIVAYKTKRKQDVNDWNCDKCKYSAECTNGECVKEEKL